ncbi:MAG: hypothetical protein IT340_12520 [Chloroflexi bacterium]|nr:hypothetical protein [Chloroflexota bacterium]
MSGRLSAADLLARLRTVRPAPIVITGMDADERRRARVRQRLYAGAVTVDEALALDWEPQEAATCQVLVASQRRMPWTRTGTPYADRNPLLRLRPVAATAASRAAAYSP